MEERFRETEKHEADSLPMEFVYIGEFEKPVRSAKAKPLCGIYAFGSVPLIDIHARAGLAADDQQTLELYQERHTGGRISTNSHFACLLGNREIPVPDKDHKLVLTPDLGFQLPVYLYEYRETAGIRQNLVGTLLTKPKTPSFIEREDSVLLVGHETEETGVWQELFKKVTIIRPEELLERGKQFDRELSIRRHKNNFRNDEAVKTALSAELFPELMICIKLSSMTISTFRDLLEGTYFSAFEPAVICQGKSNEVREIDSRIFYGDGVNYWLDSPGVNPSCDSAFRHYLKEVKAYR